MYLTGDHARDQAQKPAARPASGNIVLEYTTHTKNKNLLQAKASGFTQP